MRLSRSVCWFALLGVFLTLHPARAEFGLRDGDTVVFLGDSITAERTYGKVVENYTLLRYPDRHVQFINAGRGGDTAAGGLKRLDREVLDAGATVVIVAYGINDIGWGTQANDEHRNLYLDSIRSIVERCKARKVRVYIASAPITNESNDHGATDYLQLMCDDAMTIAREMGEQSIDIQRSMRTIHRKVREARATSDQADKDKPSMHTSDGIHLNELGQVAMAYAVLKGLGAPAEVSSVVVDVNDQSALTVQGCQVSNVKGDATRFEFDRLDAGLPINFGALAGLRFHFVPYGDQLNGYTLTVKHLPPGQYAISADDRPLGHWSANQMANGVNLASATANGWEPGGPWEAEAWVLRQLTDARSEIAEASRNLGDYLPNLPNLATTRDATAATLRQIEANQRRLVQPRPFHFVITPYEEKAKTNPKS